MDKNKEKFNKLASRHRRVKAKIKGTKECPRFSVFRSSKHLFLQLIDDKSGKTIVSASDSELKSKNKNKTESALEMGKLLAKKAIEKKIKTVVFDRGGYMYHGRVKAVADGAREAGLKF